MPYNCPVCNNTDYEEIDGLFFCTECQTQSQELISQEAAVDTGVAYHQVIRTASTSTRNSKKKPKPSPGRPWTIYEAYQVVIAAQVEALIALGAKEQLRDVVFTIWANYLSKLGVAFCTKEKVVPDIVIKTGFGRMRELHRGTLNDPLGQPRNNLKALVKYQPPQSKDGKCEDTFYDGDNPADGEIVFLDETIPGKKDNAVKLRRSHNNKAAKSPEWMNMNKTIAICYIGLMFTDPNILPYDVIRFIYEGKVPFLSVSHLLPPDMVLSVRDTFLFDVARMNTKIFLRSINKLLMYLKLNRMPHPDMDVLIPRFVQELCLPRELVSISLKLKEKIPFVWKLLRTCTYKRLEMAAISYIVLALKITFILDDSTENKLSKYSQKLQNLLQPDKKLFVWNDWRKFIMQKTSEEFSAYRDLNGDVSKSKMQHADEFVDVYYKTESHKRKYSARFLLNPRKNPRHSYQDEFRNALRKPLETALERFEGETTLQQAAVSRSKKTMTAIGQEFYDCTLNHIVNISLFQRQVEENSPEHSMELSKLLKKYSLPRTEVIQYNEIKDLESPESNRHESYLWLVKLASEVVDCSVMEIDMLVLNFLQYLVKLSQGTLEPGLVCGQKDMYCASEINRRKTLPLF